MGKKSWTDKDVSGLSFLELTGSDSSSRADLHTGTDVECYCHSKGVVHHVRGAAFQNQKTILLPLTDVRPCDAHVMMQAENG